MHAVETLGPLRERVGIGFNLTFERIFHALRAVDLGERVGEFLVAGEKLLMRQFALSESVFGFISSHRQQRHHQFPGVRFRQPCHVLIDDAFDRVAGFAKIAAQARVVIEAKRLLLAHQFSEGVAQNHDVLAQAFDICSIAAIDRARDGVETLQRDCMRLLEAHHQIIAGVGAEVLDDDPHRRDRAFEIAAGVGETGGTLDRFERGADVAFAGHIGESIGEESDHRDQRQHDNAGANRNRGQQPVQPIDQKR